MWYYESNHQPVGPVSQLAIVELLRNGSINALTLVWQEGMTDWKHLGETELNELSRSTTLVSPILIPGISPQTPYSRVNPAISPVNIKQTPRVNPRVLRTLFTWWSSCLAFSAGYNIISALFPSSSVMVGISCLAEVVIIVYTVIQFVFLYHLWKVDQDGFASISAGKAVGFLFIPFFQIYWVFRAYLGLAIDQNRYIAAHFADKPGVSARKSHPLLPLFYLLITFGGGIYLYATMFSSYFSTSTANFDITALSNLMTQYSTPITIYSLVTMVLSFLVFLDFYLTAKSIVDIEAKQ